MVGGQFSNFGAMGDYLNGRGCSQRTLSIRGTPLSALVSANFALAGEGARPTPSLHGCSFAGWLSTCQAQEMQRRAFSHHPSGKAYCARFGLFPCCTGAIGVTAGSSPACGGFGMTVLFIFIFLFLFSGASIS